MPVLTSQTLRRSNAGACRSSSAISPSRATALRQYRYHKHTFCGTRRLIFPCWRMTLSKVGIVTRHAGKVIRKDLYMSCHVLIVCILKAYWTCILGAHLAFPFHGSYLTSHWVNYPSSRVAASRPAIAGAASVEVIGESPLEITFDVPALQGVIKLAQSCLSPSGGLPMPSVISSEHGEC